jgi:hypothetical protein
MESNFTKFISSISRFGGLIGRVGRIGVAGAHIGVSGVGILLGETLELLPLGDDGAFSAVGVFP